MVFVTFYNIFEIQPEILADRASTGSANTKSDVKKLGEGFHKYFRFSKHRRPMKNKLNRQIFWKIRSNDVEICHQG